MSSAESNRAAYRIFGHSIGHWAMRFAVWARRVRVADILAVVLSGAAFISVAVTYLYLSRWQPGGPRPRAVLVLLDIDLLLFLGLAVLVARRLVRLRSARRTGRMGSRLHLRFVLLFGLVAITPAILMVLFSSLFFTFGLQSWFSDTVRSALNESDAVAKAYLEEHQNTVRSDARAVASAVVAWGQLTPTPSGANNDFLQQQIATYGLTEAEIFIPPDWRVIAKAGYTAALQLGEEVPLDAITQANMGEVAVVTSKNDRVRALVRLSTVAFPAYLYVARFVDPTVLGRVTRTGAAVEEYRSLETTRSNLEIIFTLLFAVVSLLMLMVSIWFGLALATRLAGPIVALINAAERIGAGDLSVRVAENTASDEISYLSRAFNRMTRRIDEQQNQLREANAQIEERHRFTATVLDGVSAGVIGCDAAGNMTLPNRSASALLAVDLVRHVGLPLAAFAPEFMPLFDQMRADPERRALQREVHITRGNVSRTVMLRISAEREDNQAVGYVFTFDDITALQSAQRKAAWADVARRIAHEIKNPLTPIQLSAERLKRKYRDRLGEDSALLTQCTDTIIRHVSDIGHMVDEFSAFARMPAPVIKEANLGMVVGEAVALQRAAFAQVKFIMNLPESPVMVRADARQISQAVTNVVKNALEAIEARFGGMKGGRIMVSLVAAADGPKLWVDDNGVGLPQGERERLTEPYVTTRAKGTGLGLAIVKKIVEDHGGTLTLEDAPAQAEDEAAQGARIILRFPANLFLRTLPDRAAE